MAFGCSLIACHGLQFVIFTYRVQAHVNKHTHATFLTVFNHEESLHLVGTFLL